MIKHTVSFFFCLILTSTAFGAEKKLPISSAVAIGIQHSNDILASQSRAAELKAQRDKVYGTLWPSLSSDASAARTYADQGSSQYIDGQYALNLINGTLSLNPGAFYHSLKGAQDALDAAESSLRKKTADTEKNIISLFYTVILARETLQIQESSLAVLQENLKTADVSYKNGLASRTDLLAAQTEYANAKTLLLDARNDFDDASARFNAALGTDEEEQYMPEELPLYRSIADSEHFPDDADMQTQIIKKLFADAAKNSPALAEMRSTLAMYGHLSGAEDASWQWPVFSLNGRYTRSKTLYNEIVSASSQNTGWTDNASLTAGVSYKWGAIAPWDQSHASSAVQNEKQRQTQCALDEFMRQMNTELQSAYRTAVSSQKKILTATAAVSAAEETLKAAQTQYRSGMADSTQVLNANVRLITAKKNLVQAICSFQLSKSSLNSIIGSAVFPLIRE